MTGMLLRRLTAVLFVIAPIAAVAFTPWAEQSGLVLLGMLPAVAAMPAGAWAIARAGLVAVVTAGLAVLILAAEDWRPALGVVLVVVLCIATAVVVSRGLQPAGVAAIMLAAYILINPGGLIVVHERNVWVVVASVAVVALVGSLWVLVVAALLLRKGADAGARRVGDGAGDAAAEQPAKPGRVDIDLAYAALLAVLCGGFKLAALIWFPGSNAWWAVMAVALILQPTAGLKGANIAARIAGTMFGATAAAIGSVYLESQTTAIIIGVAAALLGAGALLAGLPYWIYSTLMAAGIVMLTFEPTPLIEGDIHRVIVIILVAAATTAVTSLGSWLLHHRDKRKAAATS